MNLETHRLCVESTSHGKRLPGATYVIRPREQDVPASLWKTICRAEVAALAEATEAAKHKGRSARFAVRVVAAKHRFAENGPEAIKLATFAGRYLQFDPSARLRPALELLRRQRHFHGFRV